MNIMKYQWNLLLSKNINKSIINSKSKVVSLEFPYSARVYLLWYATVIDSFVLLLCFILSYLASLPLIN